MERLSLKLFKLGKYRTETTAERAVASRPDYASIFHKRESVIAIEYARQKSLKIQIFY